MDTPGILEQEPGDGHGPGAGKGGTIGNCQFSRHSKDSIRDFSMLDLMKILQVAHVWIKVGPLNK